MASPLRGNEPWEEVINASLNGPSISGVIPRTTASTPGACNFPTLKGKSRDWQRNGTRAPRLSQALELILPNNFQVLGQFAYC